MNSSAKAKASQSPNIPLVNLFAYIRDLFHTAQPELNFEETDLSKQKVKHFVSLQDILELRNQALPNLQWQTDSPDKAILQLKRSHVQDLPPLPEALNGWVDISKAGKPKATAQKEVRFEESPKRQKAFKEFFKQVNGKKLDEVSGLIIPDVLENWISISQEGEKLIVSKFDNAIEAFEADPLRKDLLKAYKNNLKKEDHSKEWIQQGNGIYDTIHDWYYRLKAQPELQLFLSFGLFQAGKGTKSYNNYLFHIPLKLELHRQELRLFADTLARTVSCEQHFTELIPSWFSDEPVHIHEQRQREVIRAVDQFNEQRRDFNLDEDELKMQYYFPALDLLGIFPSLEDQFFVDGKLNYAFPEKARDQHRYVFSFSPVIQLRHPGNHINVSKDANLIMEKIHELNKGDQQKEVPSFFRKMFSLKKEGNPLRIVHKSQNFLLQQEVKLQEQARQRYYFPLAYNQEQLAIAQRLEVVDAATVQGPPGTGKSHTIANLAAHYAAMGKSVLIVSKYAKALEVIKGKLPADIQDLAVSFTDNEQHREALKHSIDGVKSRLHDFVPSSQIDELESSWDQLELEFEDIFSELTQAIGRNGVELKLFNKEQGIWQTAPMIQWLEMYAERWNQEKLVRDRIASNIDVQAIARELSPLLESMADVDMQLAMLQLPAPEDLPRPELINKWAKEAHELTQSIELEAYDGIPVTLFDEDNLRLWQELKAMLPQLDEAKSLFAQPDFQLSQLKNLLVKTREARKKAEMGQERYLHLQHSIPPSLEKNPGRLWSDLNSLINKFNKQGKLSLLKRNTLPSAEKALFDIQLNGKGLATLSNFEEFKQYLDWKISVAQLEDLLGRYFSSFQMPIETKNSLPFWGKLEQAVEALGLLEKWNHRLEGMDLPSFIFFKEDAAQKIAYYDGLSQVKAYQEILDKLKEIGRYIPQNGNELLQKLKSHCEKANAPAYKDTYEEFQHLSSEVYKSKELHDKLKSFAEVLPDTLSKIYETGLAEVLAEEELLEELLIAQLKFQLESHLGEVEKVDKLLSRLREINLKKSELNAELVSLKAWRFRQENITDEQRSALSAWRNDLINLGKGYGKNASQHLQSAVKNLQLARELVPIWIMSLEAAIRFFPDPQPGQFDLLIIDEASQVDISALNLIFRSKKTLIVGDENQTSVFTNSALFPIERTNRVLDRYLGEHPFKQQFNINNRTASIYSLSGVIYPNIITLKEHFRCKPELISYSNKFVYNGHIIPLRTATHQWYGPAAEVKYIEDESRNKKKPNIVKEVVSLIEDTINSYKEGQVPKLPTIGILCLDSSNEAHREALQRALFRSPIVKSYQDELRLLIGTSREFQGDERDVMILTTTASHSMTKAGVMRPPRAVNGEEMMRIYNVAISRAKEKLVLLHGIHPEAVPIMKPECYRGRLIKHLQEVSQAYHEDQLPAFRKVKQSVFLTEIESWVQTNSTGWTISTNHKIGPYKMDLALISSKGKVAIWCDEGHAALPVRDQLRQQLVLERAGWKGMRIQALEWFGKRSQVITKLEALLEIDPTKGEMADHS
ncbi:MAG: AAA family ATPase [Bacteroidia bacterium]|nr:AAA family ATPase [Bacteroidia bacterium]